MDAMRTGVLAQLDSNGGTPDWDRISSAVVGLAGILAAAYAAFRSKLTENKPALPQTPKESLEATMAGDGDAALAALQSVVKTLQGENDRLWIRIKELEERDGDREARSNKRDGDMRSLRAQVAQLRQRLIQAGIDPGGGDQFGG